MGGGLTIETGHTVHVVWSVFEHSLSHVVLLHAVDWGHLHPPPTHRQDERISGLEQPAVPAVLLEPDLHEPQSLLPRQQLPDNHWVGGVKVLHKLTRNTCTPTAVTSLSYSVVSLTFDLHPNIAPRSQSFVLSSDLFSESSEL